MVGTVRMPSRRPSPAAERQRRYRTRLRAGLCLAHCELRPEVVEVLLDEGLVTDEGSRDRRKLGTAVASLLDRLMRRGAA